MAYNVRNLTWCERMPLLLLREGCVVVGLVDDSLRCGIARNQHIVEMAERDREQCVVVCVCVSVFVCASERAVVVVWVDFF